MLNLADLGPIETQLPVNSFVKFIKRSNFLLVLLLISVTAQALTVRPPTFAELVGTADAVIIGEITHVECVLKIVENKPVPFTLVTVDVIENLKGPSTEKIVLQCLGGTVGSESLRVIGVPELIVGDRGFFFVQNNGTQFFPLVAVGHGIYRIERDERSGTDIVTREDGEPLTSESAVSVPFKHSVESGRVAAMTSATPALTPARFSELIKTEAAHASR